LKTQTLQTEHSKASKTQRCRPSLPSERGRWHFFSSLFAAQSWDRFWRRGVPARMRQPPPLQLIAARQRIRSSAARQYSYIGSSALGPYICGTVEPIARK
jgi:hypothetical protein